MFYLRAPLHIVYLKCGLVTGFVPVGLHPCIPAEGVSLMLDNDLARKKVFPLPVYGRPSRNS